MHIAVCVCVHVCIGELGVTTVNYTGMNLRDHSLHSKVLTSGRSLAFPGPINHDNTFSVTADRLAPLHIGLVLLEGFKRWGGPFEFGYSNKKHLLGELTM